MSASTGIQASPWTSGARLVLVLALLLAAVIAATVAVTLGVVGNGDAGGGAEAPSVVAPAAPLPAYDDGCLASRPDGFC
jgi:hypothetical protein